MSSFSPRKEHSKASSTSTPASGLPSSQVPQFSTNSQSQSQSQSHLQSPQQAQQSQLLCPWSAHTAPSGQWPSPFPRRFHALSTSATAAGELFLFGGYVHSSESPSNDLYVISTQDFSTTLLKTSGDVPSPRFAHRVVLTSTILLIWGGRSFSHQNAQSQSDDDSFYLLNLVSREWTRIVVDGPGPCGRYDHTMTLVGSKLFVFGGLIAKRYFNDIWALDLNCLKSNPFWESYEPAPRNEKPSPRAYHVSVATGNRIIIFGGYSGRHSLNDTWSFNISTRKWTELQCTGSVPSRVSHAAVLVDDVMYVFGGDGTELGYLTALNLSTQRWTEFQDIGPSPSGRFGHAMACDGTRVFVVGGAVSEGRRVAEAKLIHVLDTKHLDYPKPDSGAVNPSDKATQLARKSSVGPPVEGQPQQPSPSSSDTHSAHGASPFQKATPEELDPTSEQISREQNPSLDGLSSRLPSRPTGASGRPRRVPEEDDDDEDSAEHHAKLVAPDAPSGKEIARLEDGRLIELERQLSETLDELILKSALLEQAEANAAKVEKHAGLELRELQAKLDESLLSRDHALEKAEANAAEEKKHAELELRELQAKLDKSLQSRDHALEQAQSALQNASCAAEANEQSQRDLTEMRAELEASKSELAACRLQLADTENGCGKSKAEAKTYRTQTATGLVNTDEDRIVHRLLERMQAMEAEIASLRWNEKSFEMMECSNEE